MRREKELKEELKERFGEELSEMWGLIGGQFIGNVSVLSAQESSQ